MSTDPHPPHAPHASHSSHSAPASSGAGTGSGGFKYFVPGLIIGFILGGVVGVLLPEFVDRGGPALKAPTGDAKPRVHDEEERMNNSIVPETPVDADGNTVPDAPADSTGTTAPDGTTGGGH